MARDLILLKSSMFLIHGSDIVFHQDYQIDGKLSKTQPKNLAGITLVALLFAVLLGLIALRIRRRESPVMRAFCTNCGGAVMPEDIYCGECGGKL